MEKVNFVFSGSGGTNLPAVIWAPEKIRAVVQVAHGMTEHMGRYEDFAAEMAARGIAVAGFDLRGHGKNPGDPRIASCGEGGWWASVEDIRLFHAHLREKFPGAPCFLLGFSLGSFLLRDYLSTCPTDTLAGAVIMGTGHQPGWLLAVMMGIVAGQVKKAGFDGTTDLVRQLSFGTYNRKFKPNRTEADWLTPDPAALDAYLADPLVRRDISAGLFRELLGSMKRRSSRGEYHGWDKDLPILLLSGGEDPVGNGGKGVAAIYRRMQKSGMKRVTMKRIPGARHDILHDSPARTGMAQTTLAEWLEAQITAE